MNKDLILVPKEGDEKDIFHFEIFDQDDHIGNLYLGTRVDEMGYLPVGTATNIYYEIKDEFKKRGYGRRIFSLALKEAKRVKKNEIMISYVGSNEDEIKANVDSGDDLSVNSEKEETKKVVLERASVSDVQVVTKDDGSIYHRYNINLN